MPNIHVKTLCKHLSFTLGFAFPVKIFNPLNVRKISRKTYISYLLISTRKCAYQGVRNVSFRKILLTH